MRQHTSAYVSIRQHTSAFVSICQHTSAYAEPEAAEDVDKVFFCKEAAAGKAEPKDAVVDAGRLELVVPCGRRRKWSRGRGFFEVGKACESTRAGGESVLLCGCRLLPPCACFWWLLGSGLTCGVDEVLFCIGGLPTIGGALRFEGEDTRGRGLGPPCMKRRHSSSQKIYKRALILA